MIDRIYILNLAKEKERNKICTQYLLDAEVPDYKIKVWRANDIDKYKNNFELCRAAHKDGFKLFANLIDNDNYKDCYPHYLAQTWNYLRFFEHVAENEYNMVLMHDDVKLNCTFEELDAACAELPTNFNFAFLSSQIKEPVDQNRIVGRGPWGLAEYNRDEIDQIMLFTPKGAKRLLDYFKSIDWLGDGWFMVALWHHVYNGIPRGIDDAYELLINPKRANMTDLKNILTSITKTKLKDIRAYSTASEIGDLPPTSTRDEFGVSKTYV